MLSIFITINKKNTSFRPGVLKWWVAGPEFLTLDSMRAPKFRH